MRRELAQGIDVVHGRGNTCGKRGKPGTIRECRIESYLVGDPVGRKSYIEEMKMMAGRHVRTGRLED